MLKFFYKTLLVSLLSGSLLLLDFSYKGAILNVGVNSVQAETLKTEGISDSDLMGTLTMSVVGVLASRLYSYKMTTDIMLAAAGGAIFIAGEILATIQLKKVMKDIETELKRDENGKLDQRQIEVLEKLRQSYVKAKETANTKKNLQLAAAAAFAAAAAVAYTMATADLTAVTTCSTGITTALTAVQTVNTAVCAPLIAGTYTAAAGAACEAEVVACTAALTATSSAFVAHELARQASGPSAAGLTTTAGTGATFLTALGTTSSSCLVYTSAAQVAFLPTCSPVVPAQKAMYDSGGLPLSVVNVNHFQLHPLLKNILYPQGFSNEKIVGVSPQKNILNKALDFVFPEAHAELFSAMGIASSLAIKFILATSATLGPTIDLLMLIPWKRAIVWGMLGAATLAATKATENQIKIIEGNISKIDAILNSLYALANGVKQENNMVVKNPKIEKVTLPNQNTSIAEHSEVDLKAMGGGSLPCITGNGSSSCPSFSEKLDSLKDVKNLPALVQAEIGNISKLADGINGQSKLKASTFDKAQVLAGQVNSLRKIEAVKRKQLQDKLKSKGMKRNLAKEAAKFEALMKAAVQKELDKSRMSAGDMLASFGNGSSSRSFSDMVTNVDKGLGLKDLKDLNYIGPSGGASKAAAKPVDKLKLESDEDTDDGSYDSSIVKMDTRGLKADDGSELAPIEAYDVSIGINQDDKTSIFEVISKRYQKSGYPRLLKKKVK